MPNENNDMVFARLVFDAGLADKEQIKSCMLKMKELVKSGTAASLAGVMVASGLLSEEKAREIWRQRKKSGEIPKPSASTPLSAD